MRVSIGKITSAVNKISDMTSGDKTIPGVMLDLSENLLKVCYTDGHKSLIEKLEVTTEEGDNLGAIVVEFSQLARAISNCQPAGIIKVSEAVFTYNTSNRILTISADQMYEDTDDDGNIVESKKLATKKMDLIWVEPGSDMKSAILTRMKYEDIFEADVTDEFNKKELIDALAKTSTEKGKQIYLSHKTQSIFVANQAHATSVPVSKLKELSQEDIDVIYADMTEKGFSGEELEAKAKEEIAEQESRIHFATIITQSMAKSLIGILNKTSAETVYLHTRDKCCNIYIDSDEETLGVWFEMPMASKAHTGALDRYSSMKYRAYQMVFMREFLDNNVKSALNATKSDKTVLKFGKDENGSTTLVISSGSGSASIADTYAVAPNDIVDPTGDLESKTFNVSLKILADMLAQLKSLYVALDIEIGAEGATCLRLADIDIDEMNQAYLNGRVRTKELCTAQGIAFDESSTPTPIEVRLESRDDYLTTKQFTMLAR